MSIDQHLIHQCDIYRLSGAGRDAYGGERQQHTEHATNVRCRLVEKTQRVADTVTGHATVITTYTLLLPRRSSVQPGDLITNVRDETGTAETRSDGTLARYRVESLLRRRGRVETHRSLILERMQ